MFNRFANYSYPTKVVLVGLLIASPWLIVQIGIVVLAPDVEITSMPTCEQDSGNCAHLGGGEDYRLEQNYPTMLNVSAESAYDNLLDYIEENKLKVLIEQKQQSSYFVHFVETTSFWQFPDDVVVNIQQTDDGSLIEIHSESRLGWGDLGLNVERIDRIYQELLLDN
mgnify:CR=1 FL=1